MLTTKYRRITKILPPIYAQDFEKLLARWHIEEYLNVCLEKKERGRGTQIDVLQRHIGNPHTNWQQTSIYQV